MRVSRLAEDPALPPELLPRLLLAPVLPPRLPLSDGHHPLRLLQLLRLAALPAVLARLEGAAGPRAAPPSAPSGAGKAPWRGGPAGEPPDNSSSDPSCSVCRSDLRQSTAQQGCSIL